MKSKKNGAGLSDVIHIRIVAPSTLVSHFRPLFQAGFRFRCMVGSSIEDFLLQQLDVSKDIVQERISTVFLNGCCVDHIESAVIEDDAVLALSAALPGLAGASLRRGGFYAPLRDAITRQKEGSLFHPHSGIITVKLFNLLIEELGAAFLRKGIIVNCFEITAFFYERTDKFWEEIRTAYLDDMPVSPRVLAGEGVFGQAESVVISIQQHDVHN